ncbi:MAG: response regulator [Melioribacteraceae bacterium]|nr:response regulator [Melioribacteraceae bacterium]
MLIVEDELDTQKTLSYMLKGYTYVFCESDKQMKKILRESDVKLFIIDIGLRGLKNGIEIIKELRQDDEYSKLPIICMTSYVNSQQKNNARSAGVDEYLEKPFSKTTLLEVLKNYLTTA